MLARKIPFGAVIALCIVSISCWYLFTTIHPTRSQPHHEGQALIPGVLQDFVSGIRKSWNGTTTTDHGLRAFGQNEDLILYAYSESEAALENIAFFRRHALHSKADFIFIFNGQHTVETSELRHLPNVRVIERENTCLDLGAYWEVLRADDSRLARAYKRYILMNASLRGPFLPSSSRSVCWSDAYMDRLDDVTKLVGMTWNCAKGEGFAPHLQSMIWAMDAVSLNEVILPSLRCFADMADTVANGELVISGKVMDAGYDVVAMEGRFNSHRRPKVGSGSAGVEGGSKKESETFLEWCRGPESQESQGTGASDVHRTGMYEGVSIHPWDTIFAKTNREWEEQDRKIIDLLTKFADDEMYSSYDRCG
ncbi:Hypothetical predicted protein [Lecanosticta acicola]|uniref:Uncharacterized protein n=1 Tax=Lecanosticta acicola TaxID=111012 RepID=A0AAI9EDK8_9PEZI|nr:Hypothetical predicted protein [Lecanosticta acicola]